MKEKGSAIYQLFLLGLSVYVLSILVIEPFISEPEVLLVLQYIDFMICFVFLADFFVNLYVADSKREYMKWGWIDLISSIPMVDELRWGRISRIVRILRIFRTLKSVKIFINTIQKNKVQSLTFIVIFVVLISFSLCSSLILEYEKEYETGIKTASAALWWAFLNILNAKIAITQVHSSEAVLITIILNKIGLIVFAYLNAVVIAWLLKKNNQVKEGV